MSDIFKKKDNLSLYIILCVIAILYAIFLYYVPFGLDDFIFMDAYTENNGGSREFTLSGYLGYYQEIRHDDNGRFCNALSVFTTMFEPWHTIYPALTAICYSLSLFIILKITNISRNKFAWVCLLWIILTVMLPWRGSIPVRDYSLNYVWSTFLTLSFIYLVVRYERSGWTAISCVCMTLFAVLAGGWHEGFAFPAIGGFGIWTLVRRFKMSRYWYIVGVTYIVVSFATALSPGLLSRANEQVVPDRMYGSYKYFVDNSLPFVTLLFFLISLLIPRIRSKMREMIKNSYFVIMLSALVVGVIMNLLILHSARMSYWPTICSVIVLALYFKSIIDRIAGSKWGFVLAILALIACIGHMSLTIYWQRKFYFESKEIISMFDKGDTTAFYDILDPVNIPVFTLYYPVKNNWLTPFHLIAIADYYHRKDMGVVPAALRDATHENSEKLPGTSGLYKKGNALWFNRADLPMEYNMNCYTQYYLDLTLKDGSKIDNSMSFIQKFVNSHNDTIYYVKTYKVNPADIQKADYNHLEEMP